MGFFEFYCFFFLKNFSNYCLFFTLIIIKCSRNEVYYQLYWFLIVHSTKTDTLHHFLRLKPMTLTNEYCSNIELFKWNKVVNLVTLDFETVSGSRPDKSNCRKLLKQSIFCGACFFKPSIKDIEKAKKIHRTTSELKFFGIYY